jgi:mannose-6-phosphate isomerase-like protein (cupin superfamily)
MFVASLADAARLSIGGTESWIIGPTATTDAGYCVLYQILPPGLVSPAHRHAREDQVAIVLGGCLWYWVEGSAKVAAEHGSLIMRPRGRFHSVWNESTEPATILEITTPGESFEQWMRELDDLVASGRAADIDVQALAATKYGITFAGPDDPDGSRERGTTPAAAFWQKRA